MPALVTAQDTRAVKLRVRLAQIAPHLGAIERNLARHLELISAARSDGVDLLVFPELSLTGYYLRDLTPEVAIPIQHDSIQKLAEVAGLVYVVVGFVERDESGHVYCSSACLTSGRVVYVHRKLYLPTYGMFDEGRYLTAGDQIRIFEGAGWLGGLLICEDLWHLSPPLLLSRQKIDVLVVPACSPARGIMGSRLEAQVAWEQMIATYARLLQQFIVFCNRVGCEDGVSFWGGSGIWGPGGNELVRAPILAEVTVDCTIDLRDLHQHRVSVPLLADERDDLTFRELERVMRERT